MSCASCASKSGDNQTPRGCRNNGTCSSGGCNKLEVYDWLANITLPSNQTPYDIVEVRFKNSRKTFYRNIHNFSLQAGDVVVVETSHGFDVGVVSVVGELARIQVNKKEPNFKLSEAYKIIRIANQADIDQWVKARNLEKDMMYSSRNLAINLGLEMKISDVEYQADLTKATFYYTADKRIDFRQLVRDMASTFHIRVEMRQIGIRQEAARLGAIGSCGRDLCCSTWLTDFRTVTTSAARYQQLSLNPQKLSGQCGKLKCCLNFELDMYLEELKKFPKHDTKIQTEQGTARHIKTDVFKHIMWFTFHGEGSELGIFPLNPQQVKEIVELNKEGIKPKDLSTYIIEQIDETKQEYENVVGQDDLNRFEHIYKKKRNKKKRTPQKGTQATSNVPPPQKASYQTQNQPQKNKPIPKNNPNARTNKPQPAKKKNNTNKEK